MPTSTNRTAEDTGTTTTGTARRLDLVAPDWLLRVVRPEPVPPPWPDMIRAAVAIVAPLGIGIATGHLAQGLFITIGALPTTLSDRGGSRHSRLTRAGSSAVAAALGLLLGQWLLGTNWWAVLAIAGIAMVAALISGISGALSFAGLNLLVYVALASGLQTDLPFFEPVLLVLIGGAWAVSVSATQAWLEGPQKLERQPVAEVFRKIAALLDSAGTETMPAARAALAQTTNDAYDAVIGARSWANGRDQELMRLGGLLNAAAPLIDGAMAAFRRGWRPSQEAIAAVNELADAVATGRRPRLTYPEAPTRTPPPPTAPGNTGATAGTRAAAATADAHGDAADAGRSVQVSPADAAVSGELPADTPANAAMMAAMRRGWQAVADQLGAATDTAPARQPLPRRIATTVDRVLNGRENWLYAIRLALCMAIAEVLRQHLSVERSYWILMAVAIVLKPDFGSVFARTVQRGLGTLVGVLVGAGLLVALHNSLAILGVMAVLAALLPYGTRRNYGLYATLLTPLVLMLVELVGPRNTSLVRFRLVDTLIGCGIVLIFGYALWPQTWRLRLGEMVADGLDNIGGYLAAALGDPSQRNQQPGHRRRLAYRHLSDVRTQFQRALSEPPPVSTRAAAWWPMLVQLERATDAVTEAKIRVVEGAPAPRAETVRTLVDALRELAQALRGRTRPVDRPLPDNEVLADLINDIAAARRIATGPAAQRATIRPSRWITRVIGPRGLG